MPMNMSCDILGLKALIRKNTKYIFVIISNRWICAKLLTNKFMPASAGSIDIFGDHLPLDDFFTFYRFRPQLLALLTPMAPLKVLLSLLPALLTPMVPLKVLLSLLPAPLTHMELLKVLLSLLPVLLTHMELLKVQLSLHPALLTPMAPLKDLFCPLL